MQSLGFTHPKYETLLVKLWSEKNFSKNEDPPNPPIANETFRLLSKIDLTLSKKTKSQILLSRPIVSS